MATLTELFTQAVSCHQRGDLERAESLYRQIIAIDPTHADVYNNLGIALDGQGRAADAIASYQEALRRDANHADALNNLGSTYFSQGQFEQAATCFRQALGINPGNWGAHNNLGYVLYEQGQHAEAIACYRWALLLKADYPDALNNLGIALWAQGEKAEAISCYQQALRINPDHADAHNSLGHAHLEMGELAEAARCFQQAVRINPHHADAHNNLGTALNGLGRPDEALGCFQQTLRLKPHHAGANYNLGNILYAQKCTAEAAACFQQAVRANPQHVDSHNNLGNALRDLGDADGAVACYHEALRLKPDYADARSNIGNSYFVQGRFAEAARCYQQTLALEPEHKTTLFNRAVLRLLQGDLPGGWPGYEERWSQPGKAQRTFKQPRWDGAPLPGKTILLHAEQGLGDTLQFVRFAPLVKERVGRVVLECQPALVGVLADVAGVDQIVPRAPRGEVDAGTSVSFDAQISLMSLADVFGITLANIPTAIPYIRPAEKLAKVWRDQLAPVAGFKVGVVWQGSPTQGDDRLRSVPLAMFAPLARVPGVTLLSLQVGFGQEQLAGAPFPIIDLGSRFNPASLDDLAAVMPNLDLTVTVCTSAAHLAGAMGLPVWVAVKFVPYWCWLLERLDSPWYPTARLFRQQQAGAWPEVFERLAAALAGRMARRNE